MYYNFCRVHQTLRVTLQCKQEFRSRLEPRGIGGIIDAASGSMTLNQPKIPAHLWPVSFLLAMLVVILRFLLFIFVVLPSLAYRRLFQRKSN